MQTYIASVTTFLETFSIDVLVVLALVATFFGYTLRYGKESTVALILSLYVALLAFIHFPFTERFLLFTDSDTQILISNAVLFGAFTIIAYLAISPALHNRYAGQSRRRWFEMILLSIAAAALLMAFSYHVLPIASVYTFGEPVARLFAPSQFFFWWLVAPVAVLLLVGRR